MTRLHILPRMDWTKLREEFPVTREGAFLDHAGVSAASRPAAAVLTEFVQDICAHGVNRVGHWADRAEKTRQSIARLIHADPSGIALVANTTAGIDYVAEGFPWRPGDNVVFPSDEYPSNQYPWMNLNHRGVEVRRIPPRGNRVEASDLIDAIDSHTRIVAVSWVGFASGFRIDLRALGAQCRARNVFLFVDAIQGLGALPFDVQAMPVDFVACGSHKWLLGFQGAGFLYIRPDLLDMLRPQGVGAHSVTNPFNYSDIHFTMKSNATRYEGGTLNFGGIAALGASVDLLLDIGPAAVAERIHVLTVYFCEHAPQAGLPVFSSRAGDDWSGIVALDTPGRDPVAVMRQCKNANVAVNCRGGRLRVAPHCYNNTDDIDRFLDAARQGK